jgi:predicted  nucleic acid-binding Zn-ribbon protein
MLEAIEKLLILQDRDRRIAQVRLELNAVLPQRVAANARNERAKAELETAKVAVRQLESDRKKLELDAEAQKQLIDKYSLQQFQTKKNDEYKALAHEIVGCKVLITKLDDQQLELMEKIEAGQKQVAEKSGILDEVNRDAAHLLASLATREKELQQRLSELESNRGALLAAVEESVLQKYDRMRKSKGDRVLVGIDHGACGGCHMRLPTQVLISCQAAQEVITCINCGRILYFTPEMDLASAD